ncbi:hypothetical protein CXB51_026153 [Gossypium anomalum]|uniref:Uncharacterized protein n=1 Tax=Gossypium anomalum TaxID=47600 RepID=A0A8J5Y403_9ROSI|nr:hypothetical protein CXB51_026153 [Gossypium anomalum]
MLPSEKKKTNTKSFPCVPPKPKKTSRKPLSDPSFKKLVHAQTIDIKRERRGWEKNWSPFRPPVPPSKMLPQSSSTRLGIDNLLQPVCERQC